VTKAKEEGFHSKDPKMSSSRHAKKDDDKPRREEIGIQEGLEI